MSEYGRRDFLKTTAWMGAAAMAAGCLGPQGGRAAGAGTTMQGFAAPALKKLRVGVVGLGNRGPGHVHNFANLPNVEVTALCDLQPDRVAVQAAWFKAHGKPVPKAYSGSEDCWKGMCEADDVDLVCIVTHWPLHAPIAAYAMEHGKHVCVEVPGAMNLDECWQLVETSERTRRHCMMMENCCYGEIEMLTLNLVRQGILGDIIHGEGAYIHDLREECFAAPTDRAHGGYYDYWRLRWNNAHTGNPYPTHGLGPICQAMDINRGDRMDYLVSMSCREAGLSSYAARHFPADSWQAKLRPALGDMNTSVIRTALGRTIMIQHDVSSPRSYSRINLLSGTKGVLTDYPFRLALDPAETVCHEWMKDADAAAVREAKKHPLWKTAGEIAKKVGGHGGMDFLMVLRLCYCLQNGLPLDMDVYDLAAWSSLCELTERSVRNRSASVDVPDFTRGNWKIAKPLGIVDVDLRKMGLDFDQMKKDNAALSV